MLERHLVVEARVTRVDRDVVEQPEREQHGLLQPLVHAPLAVDLLGDAGLARVEQRDGGRHRLDDVCRGIGRGERGAFLEGGVDAERQFVAGGRCHGNFQAGQW
jgi:hypothetical protein